MSLNREFCSDYDQHASQIATPENSVAFVLTVTWVTKHFSFLTVESKNIESKRINYWYHFILLLISCFRITAKHTISWWQNVNTEVLKCQLATLLSSAVILNGFILLNICWGCFVTVSFHAYIKCLSFPFVNFSCCASQWNVFTCVIICWISSLHGLSCNSDACCRCR